MGAEITNQTWLEPQRHYSGPEFLREGFRPLFFLAGLWAALSVPLWIGIWSGAISYPGLGDATMWHVHEMMFGYVGAALGGFNLVMHGDGSANVFQGDSLAAAGEWEDEGARQKIKQGSFDIVVTNPPFGGNANIDDPHILSRYELPALESKDPRRLMPAEQLFVEGALKYVKRGGYLVIVLPRSIANNPGLKFIRRWLLGETRLVASIDLPKETFAEGGGVPNPSVLIVQRLTSEEVRLVRAKALDEYEVFMALPKTVGRDKRGNAVYHRTPEGHIVLDENGHPTKDDDLAVVASAFSDWHGRL